jgi:nucleoside-diphosphate-sugar epimerase
VKLFFAYPGSNINGLPVITMNNGAASSGYHSEGAPDKEPPYIVGPQDRILITGATGFIGPRVVDGFLARGFGNLRCFARPSGKAARIEAIAARRRGEAHVEVFNGNLLSQEDCDAAVRDVAVIIHLASGRGEKSFPDAYMNSVVTTRNLLKAAVHHTSLRRFVNISSFAVYSNRHKPHGRLLDESCPVEASPEVRGEAYCYSKVRQDELVMEYGGKFGIPYVIVRPGYVLGPDKDAISGRVGVDSFGPFLHLGGSNTIPFTYVENCADAIVLAGLQRGVDGEVFNIVDDDLPSSRHFLRLYKQNVRRFKSFYVPHAVSYLFCCAWQKYAAWSQDQLPPVFNQSRWHSNWKSTNYSNEKAKTLLRWTPKVPMAGGLERYFEGCRAKQHHA